MSRSSLVKLLREQQPSSGELVVSKAPLFVKQMHRPVLHNKDSFRLLRSVTSCKEHDRRNRFVEVDPAAPSQKTSDAALPSAQPKALEASDAPFLSCSNLPLKSMVPPPGYSIRGPMKSQNCLIQSHESSVFQPKLKIKNALFVYPHQRSQQLLRTELFRNYAQNPPRIVNRAASSGGFFGRRSHPIKELPRSVKGRSVLLQHMPRQTPQGHPPPDFS